MTPSCAPSRVLLATLLAAAALLAGCGGSTNAPGFTAALPSTREVDISASASQPSTLLFQGFFENSTDRRVDWSILLGSRLPKTPDEAAARRYEGANRGGTLSPAANGRDLVYTAPLSMSADGSGGAVDTFLLFAQPADTEAPRDAVIIHVNLRLSVVPSSDQPGTPAATVSVNTPESPGLQQVRFAADVAGDAANPEGQRIIWSVVESGGGTIDASGVYTAPAVPGTYTVRATSKLQGKSVSVKVRVEAALDTSVTIH